MKWGAKITFGMLIVSVLFSTTVLGRNLWMQEKEQMKFEVLRDRISAEKQENSSMVEAKRPGDKTRKSLNGGDRTVLPEYQEIAKENPDFAGWVSIEGTCIDYPVMQTPCDPEYDIHRNLAGEYSYAGVPFIGAGGMSEDNRYVFLYGHNMRNGTMFAALNVTEDEWSQEGGLFYEYEKNFSVNREEYLRKIKKVNLYQGEIKVDVQDRLVFLVTCNNQRENGRVVVVGVNK